MDIPSVTDVVIRGGVEEVAQYEEGYFRLTRRKIPLTRDGPPLDERQDPARMRGSPPPGVWQTPRPPAAPVRQGPMQRGYHGKGKDSDGAAAVVVAAARPTFAASHSERACQVQSTSEDLMVTCKNTFIEVMGEPAIAVGVRSQSSPPVLVRSRFDQLGREPCGAELEGEPGGVPGAAQQCPALDDPVDEAPIVDACQPGTQTVDTIPPGAVTQLVLVPGRQYDDQRTFDKIQETVQPGWVPQGDPELDCRKEERRDLTIVAATVNEGIGPEMLADTAEPVGHEGGTKEVYLLAAVKGEPLACEEDEVTWEDERLTLARLAEDRRAYSDFLDASSALARAARLQAKCSCVDGVSSVTPWCYVQ